jgi:hypothetical protein
MQHLGQQPMFGTQRKPGQADTPLWILRAASPGVWALFVSIRIHTHTMRGPTSVILAANGP